jgi:hypothetical protein
LGHDIVQKLYGLEVMGNATRKCGGDLETSGHLSGQQLNVLKRARLRCRTSRKKFTKVVKHFKKIRIAGLIISGKNIICPNIYPFFSLCRKSEPIYSGILKNKPNLSLI